MKQLIHMKRERRLMLARWVLADTAGILGVYFGAMLLAGSALKTAEKAVLMEKGWFIVLAVSIFLLWSRGLYAIQAKYVSLRDLGQIYAIGTVSTVTVFAVNYSATTRLSEQIRFPLIYGLAFAPAMLMLRRLHQFPDRSGEGKTAEGTDSVRIRTLVLGGGDAGEMVVREMLRVPSASQHLVGIVDDDPRKSYTKIHGVPVIGATTELDSLVEKFNVDEILIAVPSADGETMRHLASVSAATGARVRTLPPLRELIAGRTVANQIREIDISDLLRRPTVPADISVAASLVRGEVILITGAGGSIGSELARQVARLSPAKLILLGKGENSIFEVEQQLIREGFPSPVAVIADVRDSSSMAKVFARHRPSVVFHAAAHKHVPLMQSNPIEAVRNNVIGTVNVVEAALENGAKKFIMVSTDKAVHPCNVMGATKRVAELVVRAWTANTELNSVVVRFGNVLGSRGSLVPMLKAQIQGGGPVRITHPDMTRFFMTIPEAVQLITHAGAMGSTGETFILDMGEPIRILDLATDLIRLHGYEPNQTMPIIFTGARPGEKLEEELAYASEELTETSHPKIRSAVSTDEVDEFVLRHELEKLTAFCDRGLEDETRAALMQLAMQGSAPQPDHAVVAVPVASTSFAVSSPQATPQGRR
jgi:FlaA1/EpsC-like NDP-sugar epimerase